jgi:hypothetical protein
MGPARRHAAVTLDPRTCEATADSGEPEGLDLRLTSDAWALGPLRVAGLETGVRAAPDVVDAEGRVFPAWRWVQLGEGGAEVTSRTLDAGYRTRIVGSIDGGSFAAIYADPGPERAPRWSVYDLTTGERLARLAPTGVTPTFLAREGRVFAELAGGGVVAFDRAGVEAWRVAR